MNRDPNEYTVTQGGAVYSRPIGASDFDQPGARGSWRPAYPQIDASFPNGARALLEEFLTRPDVLAQIAPKGHRGLEMDIQGTYGPIRGVFPGEQEMRDEHMRYWMKQQDNPLFKQAGAPSFDITPGGDARRSRKGLSPSDVQRLIEANPDFADEIRRMYLPGPTLPGVRKADLGSNMMIAQDSVPVGADSRLPMSQGEFQQIMRERMRNRVNPAPQQPYGNQLAEFLIRGA